MSRLAWFIAAVLAVGCGKVGENDSPAAPSLDSAVAADARAEIALRDDGCPVNMSDRKEPCPPGKLCKYYRCTGENVGIDTIECVLPFEGKSEWVPGRLKCFQEFGPDGCPLGPPDDVVGCKDAGKICEYKYCGDGGAGQVSKYSCRPWEGIDGGLIFRRDLRTDCADAGL
ncbi:MAG: hypothetical protein HYV09_31200 [Deltaproteobacteria bacterium]|nr:hypothetical protein [Deltaproteobacteria bacterium]